MMATSSASTHNQIGELLARVDLAALMDQLIPISIGNGHNRRWQCPIPNHEDTRPSVTVSRHRDGHERWTCWSGGHRGDAIDLVTAVYGHTHDRAVEWLSNQTGVIHREPRNAPPRPPQATGPSPLVARYAKLCEAVLWSRQGEPARDWLHERGLGDDVLRANRVGADPGRDLMRRRRGLPPGRSPAVTFPLLDEHGDIVYVQARTLNPSEPVKYTNPSGTLAPNPRLGWIQGITPTPNDTLIICEGIPDALIATQGGYRSVALIGSWAADRAVASRLALEADDGCRLVTVFDADNAGREAGARLRDLIGAHGHDITVVEPPVDEWDLNDWARHHPSWTRELADTLAPEHPSPTPPGPDLEVGL
jgi:DNA primase